MSDQYDELRRALNYARGKLKRALMTADGVALTDEMMELTRDSISGVRGVVDRLDEVLR